MSKYQNKTVSIVRDAKKGDEGFKEQSLIRFEDGTQKVVPTADVTE